MLKKILIAIVGVLVLCGMSSCSEDEPQVITVYPYDKAVLMEIYETGGYSNIPEYKDWDFDKPETWNGVKMDTVVFDQLRITEISFIGTTGVAHQLTPNVGKLMFLKKFEYVNDSVYGEWPEDLMNCPLVELRLEGDSSFGPLNYTKSDLKIYAIFFREFIRCLKLWKN